MFLYSVKQCLIWISKGDQSPGASLYALRVGCRLNGPSYTLDLHMAGHLGRFLEFELMKFDYWSYFNCSGCVQSYSNNFYEIQTNYFQTYYVHQQLKKIQINLR